MTMQFNSIDETKAKCIETDVKETDMTVEYVEDMITKIEATLASWQIIKADMESVGCVFGGQIGPGG